MEESESRLPPVSSIVQSELDTDSQQQSKVQQNELPTTTTETIGTRASKFGTTEATPVDSIEEGKTEEVTNAQDDGSSIVIEAIPDGTLSNETESNSTKLDSVEGDQTGQTNPKLIFIERLMGLNFQRAPNTNGGFSSFLEVRDSVVDDSNDDSNKTSIKEPTEETEIPKEPVNFNTSQELPWGNTLNNLRSRWESRIRKFTFPFQNSYSVVLRASSVADSADTPKDVLFDSAESASKDGLESTTDKTPKPEISPVNKYYFQSSSPVATRFQGVLPVSPAEANNANPETNQLLRMAALSMMSKLFSALRNQGK